MDFDQKTDLNHVQDNLLEEVSAENKITDSTILKIIMSNSQDTIYFKDINSKFIANSKAHAIQFGFEDTKKLMGMSDFDFFPEEFAQAALRDEIKIMETGIPILGKIEKWVSPEGKCVWFSASKYPIFSDTGEVIGTWGTSRDITSLKVTQEELARLNEKLEATNLKLQKLSDLDGLSELFNQRRFHEVLEENIELYRQKRELGFKNTFSVILMDIDGFKLINDKFGHPMGDRAIRFLSDIIRKNKRENDICFRCGGDEFAMILLDTDINVAKHVAERLCKTIEQSSFIFDDNEINLTISVGVEDYQQDESIAKLLIKVDKKLYMSKEQGKNQVN
ncbi:MAG TPA: diguanylate cyclase [Lachnospiraceae bacterium]|nr:diguanylate cyclase [Lachnospiraceae bacterium]